MFNRLINFLSKNVITNVCLALACVAKNTHLNVVILSFQFIKQITVLSNLPPFDRWLLQEPESKIIVSHSLYQTAMTQVVISTVRVQYLK